MVMVLNQIVVIPYLDFSMLTGLWNPFLTLIGI